MGESFATDSALKTTVVADNPDNELLEKLRNRFRRRLQDRWACKTLSHTYCYIYLNDVHVQLSDGAVEVWVEEMCYGAATLLIPPETIISTEHHAAGCDSDVLSVATRTSGNSIQYQRRLNWRRTPSLTDIRSAQFRLRESISGSSSLSSSSFTSASSGTPGIGHVSGKAVKWVGLQILNTFDSIEIHRRRWVIQRFFKKIDELPIDKRSLWLMENDRKVNRTIEDLLELTLEHYKPKYQTKAIKQGQMLRESTVYYTGTEEDERMSYHLMRGKAFPLFLLANGHQHIAKDLRETVLQEASGIVDEELLMEEIVTQLFFELAYGAPSPWRALGFITIKELAAGLPSVKYRLRNLVQTGDPIKHLVKRVLEATEGVGEHAVAINFLANYADDVHTLRGYVLSPMGLLCLVTNICSPPIGTCACDIQRCCCALYHISHLPWCLSAIDVISLYPSLFMLLLKSAEANSSEDIKYQAMSAFFVSLALGIFYSHSGSNIKEAMRESFPDELRLRLPDIMSKIGSVLGETGALEADNGIRDVANCEFA